MWGWSTRGTDRNKIHRHGGGGRRRGRKGINEKKLMKTDGTGRESLGCKTNDLKLRLELITELGTQCRNRRSRKGRAATGLL